MASNINTNLSLWHSDDSLQESSITPRTRGPREELNFEKPQPEADPSVNLGAKTDEVLSKSSNIIDKLGEIANANKEIKGYVDRILNIKPMNPNLCNVFSLFRDTVSKMDKMSNRLDISEGSEYRILFKQKYQENIRDEHPSPNKLETPLAIRFGMRASQLCSLVGKPVRDDNEPSLSENEKPKEYLHYLEKELFTRAKKYLDESESADTYVKSDRQHYPKNAVLVDVFVRDESGKIKKCNESDAPETHTIVLWKSASSNPSSKVPLNPPQMNELAPTKKQVNEQKCPMDIDITNISKKEEFILIDPSQPGYSEHLIEPLQRLWGDINRDTKITVFQLPKPEVTTASQTPKAVKATPAPQPFKTEVTTASQLPKYKVFYGTNGDKTGYSDPSLLSNNQHDLHRDCIDIAVKIIFELYELQKDSKNGSSASKYIAEIFCSLYDQLSNQQPIPHEKSKSALCGAPLRLLQSSNKLERYTAKRFLVFEPKKIIKEKV